MGHDPFSPITPARLKVVLLPVGKIKRSRFLSFVERLEAQNVVRLGDISPDGRPNRNMFSPLAFPSGKVLFDLSTSDVSQTHMSLSPFEHFRQPLAVIGLADGGSENSSAIEVAVDSETPNGMGHSLSGTTDMDEMVNSLAMMSDLHPQALVHQIFIFDSVEETSTRKGIVAIRSPEGSTTTAVKTVICDLMSLVLGELAEYAKHVQGLSMLESPKPAPEDFDHSSEIRPTSSSLSHSPRPGTPVRSPGLERTVSTEDRVMHRMSMPVQSSTKPPELVRQITGASGKFVATRIPGAPSTFEDANRSRDSIARADSGSEANSTEHSRERVSVQGFGSSSATEKVRNRNKGRVGTVMGSLYLQAGRWPDALKELVESATIAKANSDYLWQAKALEHTLVALLMMAWAGMDIQIPQICYPSVTDRISVSASKSSPLVNSTSATDGPAKSSTTLSAALHSLANLLPELLNHILNLYTRAANITEETLPQLAFSETVIRFSKLLSFCHLRDGYIDEHLLNHIVLNEPLTSSDMADRPRGGAYLRKTELTNRLFRALPTSTDDALLSRDVCPILVAMASILSTLGLDRKRAFVLRELIATLIPALVHARKIGAAEMGIHPAAGLSAVEGAGLALKSVDAGPTGVQRGLDVLMHSVGDIYGIVEFDAPGINESEMNGIRSGDPGIKPGWDSNDQIMTRALRNSRLRRFGMLTLKVDLLVACVNLCEALPNFQGVLHFTVELLQTISPGIPLPPDGGTRMQSVPREEQIRLINNIKRTIGAGNKLGLKDLEAEYWDDFLVRGVELPDQPPSKKLFPHSSTDLKVAEAIQDSGKKNPFIYNPFIKTTNAAVDYVVVSGDSTIFKIDLQNPFEFELEIEALTLETEGVLFESTSQTLIIAPYSMHTVNVAGLAKETGPLKVTGCRIKVKDCRERRFPIFKNAWKPKADAKSKWTGLAARKAKFDRPTSTGSAGSPETAITPGRLPEVDTLTTTVINPQPTLVVTSGSLPQSAVMLLEGETKTFSITLQNTSSTTPVDFLLFSFKDSTTGKLESAMSNKDIPPAELYELELQLSKKALRWIREDSHLEILIGPGQTTTLNVEIFGIPGLTEATMQIDYGFLGVPKSETKEKFYTRQIILPLTVTVNASVEMVKWDILPFTGDFAWNNQRKQQHLSNGAIPTPSDPSSRSRAISRSSRQEDRKEGNNQFQSLLDRLGLRSHGDDHSLLLLDLRNAWPSPLSISIQVRDTTTLSQSPGGIDPWRRAYTVHEVLQPGHISRLVLLVPRMFLSNLHAPIPPLNPASRRQYVVSATKIPAEQELANREAFWFRAELLKHIRGTWTEDSTSREGAIELRGIRLNARMLDAMRVEDVNLSFSLSKTSPSNSDHSVHQTSRSSFTVQTETFLTLNTTILNRSSQPIHPLLRLQPSLRNQPQPTALDLSKRLVWTGMLQRALPILGPGETTKVTLGLCAMCRGEFEISGSVEELRVLKREAASEEEGLDALAVKEREKGRRIWYAREGCVIVARDGNDVMGNELDS